MSSLRRGGGLSWHPRVELSSQRGHGSINSIIHRALTSAKISSRLEPEGLSRSDGKRPDGMSIVPWSSGRLLVWDATCPNTLAASYRGQATAEAGKVAAMQRIERPTNISTWIQPTFLSHLHLRPWVFLAPRHWPS